MEKVKKNHLLPTIAQGKFGLGVGIELHICYRYCIFGIVTAYLVLVLYKELSKEVLSKVLYKVLSKEGQLFTSMFLSPTLTHPDNQLSLMGKFQ